MELNYLNSFASEPLYSAAGYFSYMSQQQYSGLAARRYREYRRQKRKESLKQSVMAFLMWLLRSIAKVLQKTGIKRPVVEKVNVE